MWFKISNYFENVQFLKPLLTKLRFFPSRDALKTYSCLLFIFYELVLKSSDATRAEDNLN